MPTLAELANLSDQNAYVGYPQLQRQANRMRLAQMGRIPENLADPRTYGFVKGLLGTTPDELGMSVLSPNTAPAKNAAYYGYQLSNLGQIAPAMMPATKAGLRLAGEAINDAMVYGTGPLARITPQPMRLDVYHGSPYKFEKFDASKIGTGEGAQAYGHGIYVAENPEVAQGYREKLTDPNFKYVPMNQAKVRLNEKIAQRVEATDPERAAKLREENKKLLDPSGALYKIDLPDKHIEKMLDWDKPLSQQPKNVQEALKGIEKNFPEIKDFNLRKWMDADPLASTWHNTVVRDLGVEPSEISKLLQKRNVAGIKYYDQISRDAKQGTRNYVIFPGNEHFLDIKTINEQPIK